MKFVGASNAVTRALFTRREPKPAYAYARVEAAGRTRVASIQEDRYQIGGDKLQGVLWNRISSGGMSNLSNAGAASVRSGYGADASAAALPGADVPIPVRAHAPSSAPVQPEIRPAGCRTSHRTRSFTGGQCTL